MQSLIETHEYDELIFGGFICLTCSPGEDSEDYGDPDTTVYWPCPTLREAGVSDADAIAHIQARRAAIEAEARRMAVK